MKSGNIPLHVFLTVAALSFFHVNAATLTWDNGGASNSFSDPDNWNPNQAPTSGTDSMVFGSLDATTPNFNFQTFEIGNGQTFSNDASFTFRLGVDAHLTLATGGTLDFSTGQGQIAEGTGSQRLTIEPGASATAWRYFTGNTYTAEFVSNSAGVTVFDVLDRIFIQGTTTLEVDLTNYNISNGTDLVLYDYGTSVTGTFSAISLSPNWSGTINYAYDQGGGDLAVALTDLVVIPEPRSITLMGLSLLAIGLLKKRVQK